jgi:hypothetical protein
MHKKIAFSHFVGAHHVPEALVLSAYSLFGAAKPKCLGKDTSRRKHDND